jgi:hypothetical protein
MSDEQAVSEHRRLYRCGSRKSEHGEEGNRGTKFEDCDIILVIEGMWSVPETRSSAEDRWYLMIRMDVVIWRTEQDRDGKRNETQHVSSSTSRAERWTLKGDKYGFLIL